MGKPETWLPPHAFSTLQVIVDKVLNSFWAKTSAPGESGQLITPSLKWPDGSAGKESSSDAGDLGSIPGSGRSPGGGNGNPLQYSCLGNPMDRGACGVTVHGVAKSQTWLSTLGHMRRGAKQEMGMTCYGTCKVVIYTVSLLHTNKFHSKSIFISSTQPRYPTNTIGYIVLYYHRCIILFTQIIQTNAKIKHFNLTVHAQLLQSCSTPCDPMD